MHSGHGGCMPPKKNEGCFPRQPGEPAIQKPLLEQIEGAADEIYEALIEKAVIERNAIRCIVIGNYQEAVDMLQPLIATEKEAGRIRAAVPPELRKAVEGQSAQPARQTFPDDRPHCPGYDYHALRMAWLASNEPVLHHARGCSSCYEILRVIEETVPKSAEEE